jgi:hypothetical protein
MPIEIKLTDLNDLKSVRQLRRTLNIILGDTEVEDEPVANVPTAVETTVTSGPITDLPDPPPAPPKPAETTPAPPATTETAELDAAGIPWDKRIHSSGKSKVAKGTWKRKRNLDPSFVAQVEAEIKPSGDAPPPPAAETPAAAPPPPAPELAPFPRLMAKMTELGMDIPARNALAQQHALESIGLAAAKPEACKAMLQMLGG